MSKILSIDFGTKRTGYAISDDSKIFAFGLTTQETKNNINYITTLLSKEKIDTILIGLPKKLNNELADIVPKIDAFILNLQKLFPEIKIVRLDERFTSKLAFQSMIDSGMKKKQRQNKAIVDEVAATILLQDYLSSL